jgi:glycosyltransferase involved in cell wall biosynthesis
VTLQPSIRSQADQAVSRPAPDRPQARGVIHVDLDAPPSRELRLEAKTLCVFWRSDRPVGQRIAEEGVLLLPDFHAETTVAAPQGGRSVSVVICTRDRPAALERCLASLPRQTLSPDEIIVVDNAPTNDDTRKVCLAAGVTYVREPRPGLDIARNAGARRASGEILAYTDDDVVLHDRWLERLTQAFDAPSIAAVTGLVLPAELETPAQWHFEQFWSFGQGFERRDFTPAFLDQQNGHPAPVWRIGAGANMAFRREVFATAGFFDERLDVGAAGCSGDSEMWHRVLANGGVCRYQPSAVVFHYHRRELEALRRQLFAYMRGHVAALLVQRETTRSDREVRRLCNTLPRHYAAKLKRRLRGRARPEDRFALTELRGALSGVLFYLTTPRPGTAR